MSPVIKNVIFTPIEKLFQKICSTFAAVKLTRKRHIASWLLLAVFVPMMLISSLHIHQTIENGETACIECVHHQCSGHLTQMSTTIHQCVLCQFLTITFVAVGAVSLLYFKEVVSVRKDAQRRHVSVAHSGIVGLRAPPAFSI